jgi:hypothetical protein
MHDAIMHIFYRCPSKKPSEDIELIGAIVLEIEKFRNLTVMRNSECIVKCTSMDVPSTP